MGEDWNSWSTIIRSTVLSSKTPLTPYEINRDTKMLEGSDIPYKALNYRTLEDMLRNIPGLKVFQVQGKIVVEGIPTEETAHITRMIRLQKSSKKKPRTTLPPGFNRYSNKKPTYRPKNKYNMPNNRPSSAEPQRRPSFHQQTSRSPTPPTTPQSFNRTSFQQHTPYPSTPSPPIPLMQKTVSPPSQLSSNVSTRLPQQRIPPQQQTLPSPLMQQKTVHFATPVQSQPKTPKISVSQRLNVPMPILDDPRLTLNNYATVRNLPLPVYKDLPVKNKSVYSSVTVNSKKYSSYPKEAKTKEEAEKLAAQAALDDLIGKDKIPSVTTSDRNLIIKRVLEIVNDHPNGMFESSVVESYLAKYNEGLPKDWLKYVENYITVDVGANKLVILSPQTESPQNSQPANNLRSPKSVSTALTEPGILKFNNLEEFWLRIYVVYNTTDIWGVVIDEDHSDKIDELAKEMKKYYSAKNLKASTVIPGKYYALFDHEWHRVRCLNIDKNEQIATVFFIDRGDEDIFPISRICNLEAQFCKLPAQSVRLSLTGLEVFEDCKGTKMFLEELLVDKDVFVKSMRFDQRYTEGRYMGTISAQLYIERDQEEINVNELVRDEILKKFVDPAIYMTPNKMSQEVYISHVSEKSIYVQVKFQGLKILYLLIKDLVKECLDNSYFKLRPVLNFDPTKLYMTKRLEDNNWYRVKIIRIYNENEVEVLAIDTGNTFVAKRQTLVSLEDISELLLLYPKQALQIRLHKISPIMFDKKVADRLRELAPKTDVFHMKVVGDLEEIPIAEFYKRTEHNLLASLNDTLALEPEITSKDDNNNAKPRLRNDRSSIGTRTEFPLKAPCIPPVDSYFDVYVTMAAHPGNFTVQPLSTVNELEELMNELSKSCETYKGPPITPSSIKVGNMYAAKYDDDGRWYRAYVSKVISKNVCAVYFCDYGDYRAVSPENLQPLKDQFFDLPYQAIKAKLFGVSPKMKGDWTVKDSLRFNELTVTKRFVSIIKSCNLDNMSSGDTVLALELIDTNTSEDIYITNILVDEKRADKI